MVQPDAEEAGRANTQTRCGSRGEEGEKPQKWKKRREEKKYTEKDDWYGVKQPTLSGRTPEHGVGGPRTMLTLSMLNVIVTGGLLFGAAGNRNNQPAMIVIRTDDP